jgi:uncharacterized protein DUF4136
MRATLFLGLCALLSAGASGAISCVKEVQAHSASLRTAPFARYHTFSFADAEGSPAGYAVSPRSAEVQRRIKPLIVAVLEEKGYTPATGKGDFVVAYGSGRREVTTRHSGPAKPEWLDEDEEEDFVEGSIVIDVFDGTNDGQVWHGASRAEINPEKIDPGQLERSVRKVLAPYPAVSVH